MEVNQIYGDGQRIYLHGNSFGASVGSTGKILRCISTEHEPVYVVAPDNPHPVILVPQDLLDSYPKSGFLLDISLGTEGMRTTGDLAGALEHLGDAVLSGATRAAITDDLDRIVGHWTLVTPADVQKVVG